MVQVTAKLQYGCAAPALLRGFPIGGYTAPVVTEAVLMVRLHQLITHLPLCSPTAYSQILLALEEWVTGIYCRINNDGYVESELEQSRIWIRKHLPVVAGQAWLDFSKEVHRIASDTGPPQPPHKLIILGRLPPATWEAQHRNKASRENDEGDGGHEGDGEEMGEADEEEARGEEEEGDKEGDAEDADVDGAGGDNGDNEEQPTEAQHGGKAASERDEDHEGCERDDEEVQDKEGERKDKDVSESEGEGKSEGEGEGEGDKEETEGQKILLSDQSTSSLSLPEGRFVPQEGDDLLLWEVVEITAEQKLKYRVRWAGTNPATGRPWAQSWVDKGDCTDDLVRSWKRTNKRKRRGTS